MRASGAAAVARARAEAEADTAARRGAGRPNATTTLPGSPTMDVVALHLVRLADGRVCDRRVYRDDYVRLRRAAAVSVFAESPRSCLVSVLSLRWQAFRVLRVAAPPPSPRGSPAGPAAPAAGDAPVEAQLPDRDAPVAVFTDARTPVGSACAPDDDAPLAAQDRAEREWRRAARVDARVASDRSDDEGSSPSDAEEEDDGDVAGRTHGDTRGRGRARRRAFALSGWSDPESRMYAGIKQKLMTRALLEARRRDDAAAANRRNAGADRPDPTHASASRRGVKRDAASAFVPSVSAPPTEAECLAVAAGGGAGERSRRLPPRASGSARDARGALPERPGAFVRAFFSRYWSYAEWMVLWHVQLLDARRALLRFGTAEDVLAWGTRRSRAEAGAHPGSERCPESVLVVVMDWVAGTVALVGDANGAGGGLLGVAPDTSPHEECTSERGAWSAECAAAGAEGGVPGEPAPPQAEGSAWQRLAAGAGGVGGPAASVFSARRGSGPADGVTDGGGASAAGGAVSSRSRGPLSSPALACLEPGFRWPARPSSQGHWSPSPYFDTRLFRYDERAAAPDERPRPASDVSLRFSTAAQRVRRVEARVQKSVGSVGSVRTAPAPVPKESGPESAARGVTEASSGRTRTARGARFAFAPSRAAATGAHARVKRTITHVFHPVYPFAMSVSQAFMQPQVVSFHLRWDGDPE